MDFTGHIRTLVPMVVSVGATWIAENFDFIIDEGTRGHIIAVITAGVFAGYYALARALEAKYPWASRLLSIKKTAAPDYSAG